MEKRTLHLLQMGKHFVYLPLYFAREMNFFGYMPGIDLQIHNHPMGTDQATAEAMFSNDPRYANIDLILTDPVCLLNLNLKGSKKPAVLGAMLTNGAFWAVDHGAGKGDGIRKLGSFKKIISYGNGTTSYGIAQRIARESGRIGEIDSLLEVVPQGMELDAFKRKRPEEHVLVLSPNLLHIEEMVGAGDCKYELAIGDTPEYDNVLVTVLVSTSEFFSKNRDLLDALLKAIQRSLLMIRMAHPDLISFAGEYFPHKEKIQSVIQKANEAGIFPLTINVPRNDWTNAVQAAVLAKDGPAGWTSEMELKAGSSFAEMVSPYSSSSEFAIKEILAVPGHNYGQSSAAKLAIQIGSCAAAGIAIAALNPILALVCLFLGCGSWIFWNRRAILTSTPFLKSLLGVLWVLTFALATVLFWKAPTFPEKWDFVAGTLMTFLTVILGLWVTREKADR